MATTVDSILDQSQIAALGKAGFVVVPKNCIAPSLLGRVVKIDLQLPAADKELTAIRQAAAEHAGMSARDLIGTSVMRRFSWPRQIAMFIAIEHYRKRPADTAKALRRSDYRSVEYGVLHVRKSLNDTERAEAVMAEIESIAARAQVLLSEAGQ